MSIIEIKNLHKAFGKQEVLHDVNLEFNLATCIALIGPNGCGKTTLLKSILGMVIPTSGSITVNKINIEKNTDYRKKIGYMPQIGKYPENMSIAQIFEMIIDIRSTESELDYDLWKAFKLEDLKDKRMRTLSGGTTQKVSAALAFLFNPAIYILDEPTAGLDPMAAEILKEKIQTEKNNSKLVLITSHMLAELDELITGVIFMQDGEVKLERSTEELRHLTGQNLTSKGIVSIFKNS